MKFKGIYTVKKNNQNIVAHNNIQTDGFDLLQNWFISNDNSNIQRVDLFSSQEIINITNSNITSDTLSSVTDIFNLYDDSGYATVTATNAYFIINFPTNKKIKAIGIDAIQTTSNTSNGDIQISYTTSSDSTQITHDNFIIPVMYKNINDYNKISVGQQKKIYYLNDSVSVKTLKIKFNDFCSTKLDYRIYSIYIYQQKQQYLPPAYMTLYDVTGNVLITKEFDTKIKDTSTGRSVIYKMCLQFDQLDTTDQVKYVSTDFYDINGVRRNFSYATFENVWTQQAMQTVQVQYQLVLSND